MATPTLFNVRAPFSGPCDEVVTVGESSLVAITCRAAEAVPHALVTILLPYHSHLRMHSAMTF
jgi:hypothetical protein